MPYIRFKVHTTRRPLYINLLYISIGISCQKANTYLNYIFGIIKEIVVLSASLPTITHVCRVTCYQMKTDAWSTLRKPLTYLCRNNASHARVNISHQIHYPLDCREQTRQNMAQANLTSTIIQNRFNDIKHISRESRLNSRLLAFNISYAFCKSRKERK